MRSARYQNLIAFFEEKKRDTISRFHICETNVLAHILTCIDGGRTLETFQFEVLLYMYI